jgi:hypothetical protein
MLPRRIVLHEVTRFSDVVSCEHGKEPLIPNKGREFLDQLSQLSGFQQGSCCVELVVWAMQRHISAETLRTAVGTLVLSGTPLASHKAHKSAAPPDRNTITRF